MTPNRRTRMARSRDQRRKNAHGCDGDSLRLVFAQTMRWLDVIASHIRQEVRRQRAVRQFMRERCGRP